MPFGGPSTNRLCIFDFTWSVDDSMNLRIFAMDQVDFLWMILSISKSMCILFTDLRKKNTWQTSIFDLHRVHLSIDLWMSFIALNLHLFKMHSILDSLVHKPFFSLQINMKEKWLHLFVVSWLHFSKNKSFQCHQTCEINGIVWNANTSNGIDLTSFNISN